MYAIRSYYGRISARQKQTAVLTGQQRGAALQVLKPFLANKTNERPGESPGRLSVGCGPVAVRSLSSAQADAGEERAHGAVEEVFAGEGA